MKKILCLILVLSALMLCACSFATAENSFYDFFYKENTDTVQNSPEYEPNEFASESNESTEFIKTETEFELQTNAMTNITAEPSVSTQPETVLPVPDTVPDTQILQTLLVETVPPVPPEPEKAPPQYKIALTFDDGPSIHTERLLDILNKHGGKATFFVVGNRLGYTSDTLKRIVDDGHEIGNHSWSHADFTGLDEQEVIDQIMLTKNKIFDITGKECNIVRPPYGACNSEVKNIGKELGVSFIGWSVDTLDWKTRDDALLYSEIMCTARDGAIVLCHDLHNTTVDAMEMAIPELIDMGYELVTVSELLSESGQPLEAGKIYFKQQ